MATANIILEVEQGVTFSQSFYWFGPDPSGLGQTDKQVPLDFTGCHAALNVRQVQSNTSTLILALADGGFGIAFSSGTCVDGPAIPTAHNGWTIVITATQTALMVPGIYWYNLLITGADGVTVTNYMCGQFRVVATV